MDGFENGSHTRLIAAYSKNVGSARAMKIILMPQLLTARDGLGEGEEAQMKEMREDLQVE